jgi:hypothetical protein
MLLLATPVLLVAVACARQGQDSAERVVGWRSDLQLLVAEAQRRHAGPARPAFSPRFTAAAARLSGQIPGLPDRRVAVEFQRLLAMLGDGHSLVYPMPSARVSFAMLPVDVYVFADGVIVTDAPPNLRELIGSRITHIGGRRIEVLLRDLEPLVSRDNAMGLKAFAGLYLIVPAYLEALGATSSPDRATLRVVDRRNRSHDVILTAGPARRVRRRLFPPPVGLDPPALYLQDVDRNYRFRTLSPGTVYMQFNQVADDPAEPLGIFSRRLEDTVMALGTENLIVDVRHNNGGNNTLLDPLLDALERFATRGPGRRLYVLTSRTTFSAAQNFINRLERRVPGVTFAGEPSMSSPNFTGEDAPLRLPFSGLTVSISTRYWQDSDAADRRPWIPVRLNVPVFSRDWLRNEDPVLSAVLREIAGTPRQDTLPARISR